MFYRSMITVVRKVRWLKKERTYLIAIFLVLVVSTPNVKATQTTITATADSYVDSSSPDVNQGGTNILYVYNYVLELLDTTTTYLYNIWLKFDLSEIPSQATVNSIILRLHTSIIGTFATNKVGVFLCNDNSWTQTGITWNNAPSISGTTPLKTVDVATTDKDYDFELTSALSGKSVVSLVLKAMQPTDFLGWAAFDSREGAQGPRLIVSYSMPSSPLDAGGIVIFGIVIIAVVAVLGVAILRLRRKKGQEKQTPTTPQLPPPPE